MATNNSDQKTTGQPNTPQTPPESGQEKAAEPQQITVTGDSNDRATAAKEKGDQRGAEALPPPPPGLPANYPRQGRPTMRKAVFLSALISVEGDRPPAQDFAREAKAALKEALAGSQSDLKITLKHVAVRNNVEDQEPGNMDEGADKTNLKEGSFEF